MALSRLGDERPEIESVDLNPVILSGAMPIAVSGMVAAFAFVGGYVAQFLGHAVEKSMPVLVRHPIQANLAAPFFTVVELFQILGFRDELFNAVQAEIVARRETEAGTS